MKDKISIRTAKLKDLNAIRDLVIELAVFERAPTAVTAQLSDYEKGFLEGLIEISVATIDDEIIGMTLYYMTFSTWKGKMLYLEDFIVKEGYRSMGIGNLLFEDFISKAKLKDCAMVKWQVLNWNKGAIDFYKEKNAIIEEEWLNGKIIF